MYIYLKMSYNTKWALLPLLAVSLVLYLTLWLLPLAPDSDTPPNTTLVLIPSVSKSVLALSYFPQSVAMSSSFLSIHSMRIWIKSHYAFGGGMSTLSCNLFIDFSKVEICSYQAKTMAYNIAIYPSKCLSLSILVLNTSTCVSTSPINNECIVSLLIIYSIRKTKYVVSILLGATSGIASASVANLGATPSFYMGISCIKLLTWWGSS